MTKPFNGKRFTKAEKLLVLKEALRLIRKPENWVKGSWKHEVTTAVYSVNGTDRYQDVGLYGRDPVTGERITACPKKDSKGRQLYGYCLEGAIDQAALNVLGFKRAKSLGFVSGEEKDPDLRSEAANQISVLSEIRNIYGNNHLQIMTWNDYIHTKHEQVISVLKSRIKKLKAEIEKSTPKN